MFDTDTLPKNWLQLFAEPTDNTPPAGGNQPPEGQQNPQNQPKTYTEQEVQEMLKRARDEAAAKARRATENEWKPKYDAAQEALDAAKPFLENPTAYMTQYLAANPQVMQAVAAGVEAIYSGKVPTQQQIAAVGRAADDATGKVAKQLEELKAQMEALREEATEQKELQANLKSFASDFAKEFDGKAFDADAFLDYVDRYCEENEIGDDDTVDLKLLYRAYKAEYKANNISTRRVPKLPGGAPPPAPQPASTKGKAWDDIEGLVAARLQAAKGD